MKNIRYERLPKDGKKELLLMWMIMSLLSIFSFKLSIFAGLVFCLYKIYNKKNTVPTKTTYEKISNEEYKKNTKVKNVSKSK